jgi:hypothetical protein
MEQDLKYGCLQHRDDSLAFEPMSEQTATSICSLGSLSLGGVISHVIQTLKQLDGEIHVASV